MKINEKLKRLRKTEGYTQKQASELLKCGYSTYQQYELEFYKPGGEFMEKLCQLHPEYTLWLMTNDIDDLASIKNQALKQMKLSEKLRLLRISKDYTQKEFSKLTKCSYSAYQKYELEIIKPTHSSMVKICQQFPEYTLWLMTDIDDVENIKNQAIEINGRTIL